MNVILLGLILVAIGAIVALWWKGIGDAQKLKRMELEKKWHEAKAEIYEERLKENDLFEDEAMSTPVGNMSISDLSSAASKRRDLLH